MPGYSRSERERNSSADTTTTDSGRRPQDLTEGLGNADAQDQGFFGNLWQSILGLFGLGDDQEQEQSETSTLDALIDAADETQDADSLEALDDLAEESPELDATETEVAHEVIAENMAKKSSDVEEVGLAAGRLYLVTADDMSAADPWTTIARNNGMAPDDLQAFNQNVVELDQGVGPTVHRDVPVSLAVGTEIYIPSAQELTFLECRRKSGTYDEAIELYGTLSKGPNVKMLDAARARASGEVGEGYGTAGVDGGSFYTSNPNLAGASSRRSKTVNGQKEYKVFWLKDFWKCSIFMNDVVWQAGYTPAFNKNNKHYQLAGKAHLESTYTEVLYDAAMPGDCYQRFGGTGSDESHNAVLADFPVIEDLGADRVRVAYDIIGAESERSAQGSKESVFKKGTNDVVEGYGSGGKIRFLRPNKAR